MKKSENHCTLLGTLLNIKRIIRSTMHPETLLAGLAVEKGLRQISRIFLRTNFPYFRVVLPHFPPRAPYRITRFLYQYEHVQYSGKHRSNSAIFSLHVFANEFSPTGIWPSIYGYYPAKYQNIFENLCENQRLNFSIPSKVIY